MPKALTRYGIPAMLALGAFFVLFALFSASRQPSQPSGLDRFAKGDLANLEFTAGRAIPAGRFENDRGDMISLADLGAKPIVLNLWFEACPPCEEEMPSLANLQSAVAPDGVLVVAVALDREYNREANRKALSDWSGGALRFYFDKSFGLAYEAGARGMPTTILYDRHGEEVARFSGAADWGGENAVALVRAIAER